MIRATAVVHALMLAVAPALSAGPCLAGQDRGSMIVLEKLYDQQDQALANSDVEKLLSFVDPDSYVFIDEKGKRWSFPEYRDTLRNVMSNRRHIDQTTRIKDVQTQDGKLVAYIEEAARYELKDETDGWVPVNETMTAEETWDNKQGEWKIVLTKTLRSRLAIDEQWLKRKQAIIEGWQKARESVINGCNFSINGCR